LLRRLMLHHDDLERICKDKEFETVAANLRNIRDESGMLLGRGALRWFFDVSPAAEDYLMQASNVTAGFFRAFEQLNILGLLIGRPERASRSIARPIAFASPGALSSWATEQADLVLRFTTTPHTLALHALLIRALGGNTRALPIARRESGLVSFNDLAGSRDLPDEILLQEDHWGVSGWSPRDLPENGIGVGFGRGKAVHDIVFDEDPNQRASHPRWKQYWLSLWGATIEAIAQSWGAPLQAVLEASEIAADGMEHGVDPSGRTWAKPKVDVIRKPR
jgi:hypothetical protein